MKKRQYCIIWYDDAFLKELASDELARTYLDGNSVGAIERHSTDSGRVPLDRAHIG